MMLFRSSVRRLLAPACAAVLWLVSLPAAACLVILYDGTGFQPGYRVLVASEADLDRIDFDNDVEAIRVIAGTWRFYRDDAFQAVNGPPFEAGPGDYADIEQQFGFPEDTMSAVERLTQNCPPPAALAILYDGENFQPPYRVLVQSEPDLDQTDFDNEVESIQIIAGTWRFYRDDGFGSQSGLAFEAGPGGYASIEQQFGFPGDRMSSVELVAGAPPPPPPPPPDDDPPPADTRPPPAPSCGPGQILAAGRCRACAGDSVPNRDASQCVCPSGTQPTGQVTNVTGDPVCAPSGGLRLPDDQQRPVCGGDTIALGAGCAPCLNDSVPNATNTQCVCPSGWLQVGIGSTSGMPICSPPSGGGSPPTEVTYAIPAGDAFRQAHGAGGFGAGTLRRGPAMEFCDIGTVLGSEQLDRIRIFMRENTPPFGRTLNPNGFWCEFVIFEGDLAPGWRLAGYDLAPVEGNCMTVGFTRPAGAAPGDMETFVQTSLFANGSTICNAFIQTVRLTGPPNADWRGAFQP